MPPQPRPVMHLEAALKLAAGRLSYAANWIVPGMDADNVRGYARSALNSWNEFRDWQMKEQEQYRPSVWSYWHLMLEVVQQMVKKGFIDLNLGARIMAQLKKDEDLIEPPFHAGGPLPQETEITDPLLRHLRETLGRKPSNDPLFGIPVSDPPAMEVGLTEMARGSPNHVLPDLSAGVLVYVSITAIANGAVIKSMSKRIPPNSAVEISISAKDENGNPVP